MKDIVVVTDLKKLNYRKDYVALPPNYGTKEYYQREDIQSIFTAVYDNLTQLDTYIHFTRKLKAYKHILIKPNLVTVLHKAGMAEDDYPESTDPRVFDAVVSFIRQFTDKIVIIESSGKPMPTKTSFRVSGIDRIAKHYNTQILALETLCVKRYMLPKAEVMKEVYLPEILDEVVQGEAFYLSVPKLKTNIYTGVTLGFKNAMGTIPYFLRERNHNYYINKKLADLLYLFEPDLVLIDGVIGGEGNTPAPVDPVDSLVIISGNNSVEVDKIGTRIMGIDPADIPLIVEAQARGFGNQEVDVIGYKEPMNFRRANASLMAEDFHDLFPNILVLAGHNLPHAPKIMDQNQVTPQIARQLEIACDGGCLCALRSGFDYVAYSHAPKYKFPLIIVIGGGIMLDGIRYWFDRDGKSYGESEIREKKEPILTVGNCSRVLDDCAKYTTPGCCNPATCMLAATAAAGVVFPLLSLKNQSFLNIGIHLLEVVAKRCAHILCGKWVDCPSVHKDQIYELPTLSEEDQSKDYIQWPLPRMSWHDKWQFIKDQLGILKL